MGKETCGIYTYTHTHSGILVSHKNEKNLLFATTCLNLEDITLSEMSDRERQMLFDITYM